MYQITFRLSRSRDTFCFETRIRRSINRISRCWFGVLIDHKTNFFPHFLELYDLPAYLLASISPYFSQVSILHVPYFTISSLIFLPFLSRIVITYTLLVFIIEFLYPQGIIHLLINQKL